MIVVEEELVELRRLHRGAGQHRMHLAAMVDLVQEQMREQIADASRESCRPRAGR